jgi:hypothetical protein
MMSRLHQVILFAILVFFSHAQAADNKTDNREIQQIFDADQKDREAFQSKAFDWRSIMPRDSARRMRVRELIDQGSLKTAKDYDRAAWVFQHGESSDDILMAHILAVTALGMGDRDARWLAATTLDRFLQRVGQPQVFGTQFSFTTNLDGKQAWTMEPHNRSFISPILRDANCVPDQENQAEALKAWSKGEMPPEPKKEPCAPAPVP